MFDRVIFLLCLAVFTASAEIAAIADTDGDIVLPEEEFQYSIEQIFALVDTDGDIILSDEEFQIAGHADRNRDGIISDEEFDVWNHAAFDYRIAQTIMSMTGEVHISKFITVLSHDPSVSRDKATEAAKILDGDKNEVISASELNRWLEVLPSGTDKAETVLMFTGNIPIDQFEAVLQKQMDAFNVDAMDHANANGDEEIDTDELNPGFTVQQAVDHVNANGDKEIDADEFNTWYSDVERHVAKMLKPLLAGDDGVITEDDLFIKLP